jgi:hypothetical protein
MLSLSFIYSASILLALAEGVNRQFLPSFWRCLQAQGSWRALAALACRAGEDSERVDPFLRIAAASVESTRSLLRSVRALQAQAALQQAAAANGTAGLTLADIDAEIAATRRARHRK